jgi:hypothetical protein
LFEAATGGRHAEAEWMQQLVVQISEAMYTVGSPETSYLRGLKRALSMLELIDNVLAEPLHNFDSSECAELQSRFVHITQGLNALPDHKGTRSL